MRVGAIATTSLLLVGLSLYAATPPAVTGDYIEVRTSHVYTCGCLYSGEQATVGKDAILAWSIQQGEFQGIPLSGSKAVAVVFGQAHLGLSDTIRKSVLYLDTAGSNPRQEALIDLLRGQYRNVLGEIIDVHSAPISFQREGERMTVSVGEISRLVVRPARLPEDAHQGSSLWYDPFIATTERTLATTEYQRFSSTDFRNTWWVGEPGITGYIGRFAIPR